MRPSTHAFALFVFMSAISILEAIVGKVEMSEVFFLSGQIMLAAGYACSAIERK